MAQVLKWALVSVEGNLRGKAFVVTEQGMSVGREVGNTLVLQDDNISRRHVELRLSGGGLLLIDLGSRNGTYVNNRRISGQHPLKVGDRLALGSHLLEVQKVPDGAGHDLDEESEAEKTMLSPQVQETAWNVAVPAPPAAAPPRGKVNLGGAIPPAHQGFNEESTMRLPPAPTQGWEAAAPAAWAAPSNNLAAAPALSYPPAPETTFSPAPPSAVPEMGFQPQGGYPPDASFSPAPAAAQPTSRARVYVAAAVGVLGLLVVVALGVGAGGGGGAGATSGQGGSTTSGASGPAQNAGPMAQSIFADASSAPSLVVNPKSYPLTAEEQAMDTAARRRLSQEVFDQAVALVESERYKEALNEFTHAYALDQQCDLCLLRANKVAQEIKSRVERYNADALRYWQALKYEQALQSWEMALLLLDDPESQAGKAIQQNMAQARQQHAQQSYR